MSRKSKPEIITLSSIGIDIGKDVFHIVGFDTNGTIVIRRKIKRLSLEKEFEHFPRCIVGMEACLSAQLKPNPHPKITLLL